MQIERLVPLAKQLLAVAIDETTSDLWLWEHSERVMRLTRMIAAVPDVGGQSADLTALAAAALFHDAGWTVEFQQGKWKRWQLLGRPTNDIQRELGAALLQEEAGPLLPGPTARLAGDAIRQCNNRDTQLLEAHILAEAEALDEVGTVYLLRQFRQYQAEGRPLQQLVDSWQRQKEYRYWELRLNDGFRYDVTRELARRRLEAVEAFMTALQRDLHGGDVRQILSDLGQASGPESA
ncbi:MAG: HD domain-containing protein [Phycisphaerae bacterium]|nr:HD domain-containing protein [Phycisphaerae bacterium]